VYVCLSGLHDESKRVLRNWLFLKLLVLLQGHIEERVYDFKTALFPESFRQNK
jgi:hypothetical protein